MPTYHGLTTSQVNERLKKFGFNEIPSQKPKSIFGLLLKILQEPMIFLLVATGITYLLLGEPQDSIALFSTIVIVIGITIYQEKRTENAVQALKDLSSPRALVIRDNNQIRIPGREVVVDDLMLLNEGDRVAADGIVVDSLNLSVDESLLTGESLWVLKQSIAKSVQGAIDKNEFYSSSNMVYSGTLVTQGSALVKISATGSNTKMGGIGKALKGVKEEEFLLKKEIKRIISVFFVFGLLSCILLVGINYFLYKDLLNAILSGLTLAIAMLPEEFPLVLIIFLTLGAYRISKKNVLARNNQGIETLGATSVLCVDKTGTLTYNKMELSYIFDLKHKYSFNDKSKKISNKFKNILFIASLASKNNSVDPLEQELNKKFLQIMPNEYKEYSNFELVKEYPLNKNLFVVTRVYQNLIGNSKIVSAKGSPEDILKICNLSETQKNSIMDKVYEMAKNGQRILGVAHATYNNDKLPKSVDKFDFEFLGLVSFNDNIRKDVNKSVQKCYKAGIRVIMITGDYPATAQFIAKQAGIENYESYLTGADLNKLSTKELAKKIQSVNIFARIVPEQKLKIVQALKNNGHVVAMTGDGVNDGPALKSANIGISMGQRGTDVARESSDLVLLDDNFNSIVSAITLGRRIYDNIQKAVSYIFSIHIPIAGVALIPVFFGLPPVLYAIHIAFFEFIIDPAYSAVFEAYPGDKNLMKRKPRNISKPLFYGTNLYVSLFQGIVILITVLLIYILAYDLGYSQNVARSMAFTALILSNLLLIITNLSDHPVFNLSKLYINKSFYYLFGIVFLVILIYLNNSFVQQFFRIDSLDLMQIILVILAVAVTFFSLEIVKLFRKLITN